MRGQFLDAGAHIELHGQAVTIRLIRADDETAYGAFLHRLDLTDIHSRFFNFKNQWSKAEITHLTRPNTDEEVAFVACLADESSAKEILGEGRIAIDQNRKSAQFGLVVRSDLKGRGIGHQLLRELILYCRARGIDQIVGNVLNTNDAMLDLARGFSFKKEPARDGVVRISLKVTEADANPNARSSENKNLAN